MRTDARPSEDVSPGPFRLMRGFHDEFANWFVLGPLSWVGLPSRCPPQGGITRLAGKRITVKLRCGYRAECRLDEFFPFVEVFALAAYEVPGMEWARARSIVDVGANVGAATLWFARQSPQATIVAVEPASRVRSVLIRNIRANRLEHRVKVVAAALADRTATVNLDLAGPSVASSVRQADLDGTEVVSAVSLEELLEQCELREVDVLKLDCEGAEFDVLLSSDHGILRRSRFIIGEYHSANRAGPANLISCLEEAGFRATAAGDDSIGLFQAVRV